MLTAEGIPFCTEAAVASAMGKPAASSQDTQPATPALTEV